MTQGVSLPGSVRRALSGARRSRSSPANAWLLPLVMSLLAGFAGMVIALGSLPLSMLVVALIVGPAVLLMPATGLISLFLLMSTVIAGCMQYFLRIEQSHWLPALLLIAMFVRLPVDAFRHSARNTGLGGLSGLGLVLLVFGTLVIGSALVNLSPPMQVLVGLKQYVFPLALIATIVFAGAKWGYWLRVWRMVPWLMLLQLPLCLYQYIFVEKGSAASFGALGIAWDRVVGSFGGNPEGGGSSGALAMFLCFGFVATLALRRGGYISGRLTWAACVAALASVFLAEVKVVAVFLPLALLVYYRRHVMRSVGSFLLWSLSSLLFVAALLVAYQVLHYSDKGSRSIDLAATFSYSTRAEKDITMYNRQTGEMSRLGALVTWGQENVGAGKMVETLIGYGPAASKTFSSLFGQGAEARKHPFQLQVSTASALLWDVGLLGTGCFALLFAFGFVQALRLANRLADSAPLQSGLMDIAAVAIALTSVGLIYDASSLFVAPVQMLSSWAIGLVALVAAFARQAPDSAAAAVSAGAFRSAKA